MLLFETAFIQVQPNALEARDDKHVTSQCRPYLSVYTRRWSSTGVPSPMELRSLDRVYGRKTRCFPGSKPPSPHGRWIQGNVECRQCLGANSVAGVAGVALPCQTTFGTQAADVLSGLAPIAFPRTGRREGSNGVCTRNQT